MRADMDYLPAETSALLHSALSFPKSIRKLQLKNFKENEVQMHATIWMILKTC